MSKRDCLDTTMIAVEFVSYVGSFPVTGNDSPTHRIRDQLEHIRENKKRKAVLLVISLGGIKVCSPDGKSVFMAHALRRISLATCDSDHNQFSFLARQPKGHCALQFCHSFLTDSPGQAELLSTIVGNAFRMAYAAQLDRQQVDLPGTRSGQPDYASLTNSSTSSSSSSSSPNRSPTNSGGLPRRSCIRRSAANANNFSPRHSPSSAAGKTSSRNLNNLRPDLVSTWNTTVIADSSTDTEMNKLSGSLPPTLGQSATFRHCQQQDDANGNVQDHHRHYHTSLKPSTLPGLNCLSSTTSSEELVSPSSVSSDDTNSPTELNSYKRLLDKPQLVKRMPTAFLGRASPAEDTRPLVIKDSGDEDCGSRSPPPPHGGAGSKVNLSVGTAACAVRCQEVVDRVQQHQQPLVVNLNRVTSTPTHTSTQSDCCLSSPKLSRMDQSSDSSKRSSRSSDGPGSPIFALQDTFRRLPPPPSSTKKTDGKVSSRRCSEQSSGNSSCSSIVGTPPPPPERGDSLQSEYLEERELRRAPWFQAGIPREIALEILSQEPNGAFMVRESTSKPGCYALSLRVPREFQPTGLAHYLIMRTNKGYKIKGFTKEFTTLTALIVHHSIMPELLPCALCLARYNPTFAKHGSSEDFADMDADSDYDALADFRKMLADLNAT